MGEPARVPVVTELQLGHFRCFDSVRVQPGSGFNLISGPNGSGKTSLLEALYLLGRGISFRAARTESAIQFEQDRATLFGRLGLGEAGRVGVEISRAEGLSVRVDGNAGTRADLARALPIQVLDPSSHDLVSGAPAERRQFLDWGVFHVEPGFLPAWQRYRRALQQRNAALKGRHGAPWAWDDTLAAEGVLVDAQRRRFLEALATRAQPLAEDLLGADLVLDYQSGWAAGTALADALAAGRDRDLQTGTSHVGPHRADIRITVRSRRARDTVSRGQEKLVAAALTLAQVALVAAARGQLIALLVDEAGADLDREHLHRLLAAVANAPAQSFVTSLDPAALRLSADVQRFHVEHGRVEALL